jgi:RimJ/RimL family protein N-acetyltransferase
MFSFAICALSATKGLYFNMNMEQISNRGMKVKTSDKRHLTTSGFEIRPASRKDLPIINRVYDIAREYMNRNGNPTQWGGGYPWVDLLDNDIEKRQLFVMLANRKICGVFAFIIGVDPTYIEIENGAWLNDEPYGTIHRIASDGTQRGIFRACFEFCLGHADNIRIDTHADNVKMQAVIADNGFIKCGTIYIASDHSPRIAYQYSKEH